MIWVEIGNKSECRDVECDTRYPPGRGVSGMEARACRRGQHAHGTGEKDQGHGN